MSRYLIFCCVACTGLLVPAGLSAQDPPRSEFGFDSYTVSVALMVQPELLPGISLQVSRVQAEWEAPTVSGGVFLTGGAGLWLTAGIGANAQVTGPLYVGAGVDAILVGLSNLALAPHFRVGARSREIGTVGELSVGLVAGEALVMLKLALPRGLTPFSGSAAGAR
jgi:hypothetical protein